MQATRRATIAILVLLLVVALVPALASLGAAIVEAPPQMVVTFIDVGQGDSIWIQAPSGEDILVDGGPPTDASRDYLLSHGCTGVEYMILTHPDLAHYGGLSPVVNAMTVDRLWYGQEGSGTTYTQFWDLVNASGIVTETRRTGDSFIIGPISITMLHPTTIGAEPSENSIVCEVSYGTVDILLTGDVETAGEAEIMASGRLGEVEVLKVAHHGSASSSSLPFLQTVSPEVAVVSVGEDNSYGHPSPTTLARLALVQASTYRTDQSGTIRIVTDGATYSVSLASYGNVTFLPLVLGGAAQPPVTEPATVVVSPPNVQIDLSCSQWDAPGDDQDNLTEEYVCFRNNGGSAADMSGWHVKDLAKHTYTFPAFTLSRSTYARLRTGSGTNSATDLYWGSGVAVWDNDGDTVFLYDAAWNLVDQRSY